MVLDKRRNYHKETRSPNIHWIVQNVQYWNKLVIFNPEFIRSHIEIQLEQVKRFEKIFLNTKLKIFIKTSQEIISWWTNFFYFTERGGFNHLKYSFKLLKRKNYLYFVTVYPIPRIQWRYLSFLSSPSYICICSMSNYM